MIKNRPMVKIINKKIVKRSSKLTLKWIQKILKKNNTELHERSTETP